MRFRVSEYTVDESSLDAVSVADYIHGACSPFGMKSSLSTIVDETAELFETVFVIVGQRGQQIEIAPAHLVQLTQATRADVTLG